ncbi:MAG: heavy metal-binding domain-containing protein [Dokdonella sp.]
MTRITGLSGNEIYLLDAKGYEAGDFVVGNCVNSMGFMRSLGSGLSNLAGGEVTQVTQQIHDARLTAFTRMVAEAKKHGASGVTGVTSELMHQGAHTEFLFTGSCVHDKNKSANRFFTSAGNAQELYCHMDAGYQPLQHVFGNIAYSLGIGGGLLGGLKSLARGEIREYSDVINATRHRALSRLVSEAKKEKANAVVGIRTQVMLWHSAHEMTMTGTAAFNPALPSGSPVTSDLTGEELWTMSKLGYVPMRLLLSTSVYSLGIFGGVKSFFQSFTQGELPELSRLVLEAREVAMSRLKTEADSIGASTVVGVKTFIHHIGNGLIEFLAIGTAVRKSTGAGVQTPELPAQAILHDKDTWIDGGRHTLARE